VHIVADGADVPPGCAATVVDERISVHIQLRGIVDPARELEKLAKKAAKVTDDAAKLAKRMAVAGYADKVPEDVQVANAEAAAGYTKTLEGIAALRVQYESWAAADSAGGAAAAAAQ
jgi:valyl-tRNA synthetase